MVEFNTLYTILSFSEVFPWDAFKFNALSRPDKPRLLNYEHINIDDTFTKKSVVYMWWEIRWRVHIWWEHV